MTRMRDHGAGVLARAEAFPLRWEELTDDQRKVVENVAKLFGELAERPWEPPRERGYFDRFIVKIDPERRNHVALIEGERGIGKTVVLLTLIAAWGAAERVDDLTADARGLPDGILRGRVVPVGLVDLQPLPRGTNLLFHLAGQLSRLVEAIDEGGMGAARHDAWNPNKASEPASRTRWRAFVQSVAAGWDGRLDARRSNLDPEAFAVEFEEAERHRLDVRERFRELADALVEEYPRVFSQRRGKPFFVIPIDDADMNPDRCPELLDLVRTLWHPRVGFLLTGENKLFLDVLKEHLTRDKGSSSGSTDKDKLARAIYEKAVPPYQRFGVRPLPFAERMAVVRETLQQVGAFDHPLRPAHLLDYLEVNRLAGLILPSNMRDLRDWETRVRLLNFEFRFEKVYSYHIDSREELLGSLFAALHVDGADDVEIAVDIAGMDIEYGDTMLRSTFSAQMMLAQDARRERIDAKVRLPAGRTTNQTAAFEWPSPRWGTWLDHAALTYLLRFVFSIETEEGVDFLRQEYTWRHHRSRSALRRDEAARAFIAWIVRYIEFRQERASGRVPGTLHEALDALWQGRDNGLPTWEGLFGHLDRISTDTGLSTVEREWASSAVALFAAPEHKLAPETANALLRHIRARHPDDWTNITADLRDLRIQYVKKRSRHNSGDEKKNVPEPAAILEQIDAQSSRYEWVLEVSRLEGPKDELFGLLKGFSNPPVMGGKWMPLSSYFEADRWLLLQRSLSDDLRRRWMERLSVLPRGGVSAPLAMVALWNEAIRAGAAHSLMPIEGEPSAADLQGRYELLGLEPWTFQRGLRSRPSRRAA